MQLKCRKCGENHLTIKCGKIDDNKSNKIFEKPKREYNNTSYKVKINNLPVDVTFNELSNILKDWGHINRINVKNFNESSYAIIEFQFEDEQRYFIEAVHSTPYGHQIISVEKLDL